MSLASKYTKSLWSYNPLPTDCVLYLPLYNPGLHGLVFKSVDPFGHVHTRVGGLMDGDGFTTDGDDKITAAATLLTAYPFTLSLWVALTTINANRSHCLAIGNNAATNEYFMVGFGTTGLGAMSARNTQEFAIQGGSDLEGTGKHLLTAVFRAAQDRELYLDRATSLVTDTTNSVTLPTINGWSLAAPVNAGTGGVLLTGVEGEAWVHAKGLNTGEITYLFDRTKGRHL
ncbi:hypothetical protein LCGC14_2957960 [marine sediment metagenome]|uniref:Uncharacterized protein n=1 Tax=marine sediment metagenome TaxID=412755 RepID=A0A0F8ZKW3_9ZZZZ